MRCLAFCLAALGYMPFVAEAQQVFQSGSLSAISPVVTAPNNAWLTTTNTTNNRSGTFGIIDGFNVGINSGAGMSVRLQRNGSDVFNGGTDVTFGTLGLNDPYITSFKVSTAPLSKTDTNFATVTGLAVALAAGKTYNCAGHLTVTAAPAAGGIKVTLANADTLTATSASFTAANYNGTTTNARSTTTTLGSAIGAATATATDIDISGAIVVNAAGTLAVQAAQNAASGTTTVGANSTFSCVRVN